MDKLVQWWLHKHVSGCRIFEKKTRKTESILFQIAVTNFEIQFEKEPDVFLTFETSSDKMKPRFTTVE